MKRASKVRRLRIGYLLPMLAGLIQLPAAFPAYAGDLAIPGASVTFKPYIEGEGGYDSNPDNKVDKVGSAFEKIEGGLRMTARAPSEYYELDLKAREVHFDDLELQDRWDFKAALDTAFDLSASDSLKIGTYYLRDFFSLEPADVSDSYATYTMRGEDYRVKLEGKSHAEHNLNDDSQGTLNNDIFNISKSEAFDYWRNDAHVALLGFTKSMIQPYAIYDFANLDYFAQAPGASIDRDAIENYAIAGLRFVFDKTFRVDLGGRYNHRDFDDLLVSKDGNWFVDINAYWQPVEAFKASLVVERYYKEPSTSFGLADDTRTVGVTADWQLDRYWRLNLAGYYDRIIAIGDDLRFDKYSMTSSLVYEPNDHIEIFLSGLAKYSQEDTTGDSYTRYKIGSGIRYKF